MNLVDRYAEELRRSHEELANILERLRVGKLKQAGRTAVSRQTEITLNFFWSFLWLTRFGNLFSLQSTTIEVDVS